MRLQVKDFMSSPVTTATGENSVGEIRAIMKEKGIHAVPIISFPDDATRAGMIIRGIITATDIRASITDNTTVEQVMTSSSVHVLHVDSDAQSAAKMMLKHNVHHMVVMDEGKIEGMVSSLDFVRLVAEHDLGK